MATRKYKRRRKYKKRSLGRRKTKRRTKLKRGGAAGKGKKFKRKQQRIPKTRKIKMSQKHLKKEEEWRKMREQMMRENIDEVGVPTIGNAIKLYKRGDILSKVVSAAVLSAALSTPQVGKEMGINEPDPVLPMQCNATNWAFPYKKGTDPRKKTMTRKIGRYKNKLNKSKKKRK
tara:strand:+ start:598 stop:1119 length:522 start_codon:yes stop_codon:yes gene_type:complete